MTRVLKEKYKALHDEFNEERERYGCTCHVNPPCGYCTHPGNMSNLECTDEAWEEVKMKWNKDRIAKASLAPRTAQYEVIPVSDQEKAAKIAHPQLFNFHALSIGDDGGQLCFIPLDEADRESAKLLIKIIEAGVKHLKEEEDDPK